MNISNQVQLIGHLGQNPELYTSEKGSKILKISIATNDYYTNDKGERVQQTDWHNLTIFGKRAELVNSYCVSGSKICVTGKLKTRKYTDKHSVERYITEIIVDNVLLLDKKA